MADSIRIVKYLKNPAEFASRYMLKMGERRRLFPKVGPMTRYLLLAGVSAEFDGRRWKKSLLPFTPADEVPTFRAVCADKTIVRPLYDVDVFWPGLVGDDWEYEQSGA